VKFHRQQNSQRVPICWESYGICFLGCRRSLPSLEAQLPQTLTATLRERLGHPWKTVILRHGHRTPHSTRKTCSVLAVPSLVTPELSALYSQPCPKEATLDGYRFHTNEEVETTVRKRFPMQQSDLYRKEIFKCVTR